MKLLNCPFCGSNVLAYGLHDQGFGMKCTNCDVFMPGATEQEAADAWNQRAVKLEWADIYINGELVRSNLTDGQTLVGSVFPVGNGWHWHADGYGRSRGEPLAIDQAKTDCEASVRASLGELI